MGEDIPHPIEQLGLHQKFLGNLHRTLPSNVVSHRPYTDQRGGNSEIKWGSTCRPSSTNPRFHIGCQAGHQNVYQCVIIRPVSPGIADEESLSCAPSGLVGQATHLRLYPGHPGLSSTGGLRLCRGLRMGRSLPERFGRGLARRTDDRTSKVGVVSLSTVGVRQDAPCLVDLRHAGAPNCTITAHVGV